MGMLAEEVDFVIGVDTHRDAHVWAVLVAGTGAIVAEGSVSADARGYRQALTIVADRAPSCRVWAVEGTGSYGAGLARYLADHGERLIEVERPVRAGDRSRLKSDSLDAVRAARSALGLTKLATPRQHGRRESLRALQTTREGAIAARTQALNQLRALIVVCPEPLRSELRTLSQARLIARCTRLRPSAHAGDEQRGTLLALRTLALRLLVLTNEAKELEREIHTLVVELAPQLLTEPGVGPISAAQLLISWSHPGRLRNEAAFARLAGAAPIPASSGQTIRYRLDRGGDRKLNRALQTIILTRRRQHPATIAYIDRRRAEGKTSRDSVRCLKRYLARHLYRLLEAQPAPA
jgi:transposase